MKKILSRLVLLIIVFVIIDFVIGLGLRKILEISPDGRYYKTNYSLKTTTDEVMVFGSSRAEANYVPSVIEEQLGLSCWNAGRGGQSFPFWYLLNAAILERHTPKIVILNIEYDFLKQREGGSFERTGFLRPYYKDFEVIRPILNKISFGEKFLIWSDLYAFNSSYYYLMRPFFFPEVDGKKKDKGWKPLKGSIKNTDVPKIVINEDSRKLDPEFVEMLDDFISSLTKKGCKVIICISPDFKSRFQNSSSINFARKREDIIFLNFSEDEYFSENPNFFNDVKHLNREGAIEFSKKLSNEIKLRLK
jgi:hypothetical protein